MATFFGLAYALEFPMIGSAVAAGCTGMLLSIGLAISTQCRVVVCLCMPTLSLKTGAILSLCCGHRRNIGVFKFIFFKFKNNLTGFFTTLRQCRIVHIDAGFNQNCSGNFQK